MFNLGWTEILVIVAIAIIIVGPRDLPGMLRSAGQLLGRMRRMASDFQKTFNDAIKDAERQVGVDEIRKEVDSVKQLNPVSDLKNTMNINNMIDPTNNKSQSDIQNSAETDPNSSNPSKTTPNNDKNNSVQTAEENNNSNSEIIAKSDVHANQSPSQNDTLVQKTAENSTKSNASMLDEKSAA